MRYRTLNNIPGLYPLDASNTQTNPPPEVTTKNFSRYCQMSPGRGGGGQKSLPVKTTGLKKENNKFGFLNPPIKAQTENQRSSEATVKKSLTAYSWRAEKTKKQT